VHALYNDILVFQNSKLVRFSLLSTSTPAYAGKVNSLLLERNVSGRLNYIISRCLYHTMAL